MPNRRQHGEGSLYQRGKRGGRGGQWVAVADLGWKNGKRDRREFTGQDPGQAMAARDAFTRKRADGFTLPKGRPPYVGEWMLHWLHNVARPKVGATTWERSYRQKTTDLIVPYFAKIRLPDLTEEDIEAWHNHLAAQVSGKTGRPLAPATVAQAHRIMSRALKVAVTRGRIGRNPCSNVSPPGIPAHEQLPPEEDEVLAILRQCEAGRTGPRWVTGIATGVRQGEALGLLWPFTDLDDDPAIDVQWELVRLKWRHGCADPHGCGGQLHRYPCPRPCRKVRVSGRPHVCVPASAARLCAPDCEEHARSCPDRAGGGLRLKRPKSAKSRRRIPLAPYAVASLRRWRVDQKAERLAHPAWAGWAHDPGLCARRLRPREHVCPDCMLPARADLVVFAQPDGTPYDSRADWGEWSGLLEAAGLPHYRVHDGRHGFATALLEGGQDIRVVQELMGHATPHFTQQAYQHVRRRLQREAADTMQRAMTGHR